MAKKKKASLFSDAEFRLLVRALNHFHDSEETGDYNPAVLTEIFFKIRKYKSGLPNEGSKR